MGFMKTKRKVRPPISTPPNEVSESLMNESIYKNLTTFDSDRESVCNWKEATFILELLVPIIPE